MSAFTSRRTQPNRASMEDLNELSHSSLEAPAQLSQHRPSQGARGRPCDVCWRRKLKCVKESGQDKCVLCTFHERDCTYVNEPRKRKRVRANENHPASADRETAYIASVNAQQRHHSRTGGHSLLNRTLGLYRTTHSRFIGASSLYDPLLLDIGGRSSRSPSEDAGSNFRRVDDSTFFTNCHDDQTAFFSEDLEDIEVIESIVRPYGPSLVDLYFRIVHPSYPILHKGVSYTEFSPPLLAAAYLLAMDWWEYDEHLAHKQIPDGSLLIQAATKAMASIIHRPKLSTRSGSDSWVLTSQLVGVAEELGLLADCSSWNIPDWEKGLRRRLSCAVFMQDKWAALIHGRPSHVVTSSWRLTRLSLDDFPESGADEDDTEGSTEVEKGRKPFIHLAGLTELISEALDTMYTSGVIHNRLSDSSINLYNLLELIKPISVILRQWVRETPSGLQMDDLKSGKLCSNGYLHLSYFTTKIMIHRQIIRALHTEAVPELQKVCREAAKTRLERAMAFVDMLRPEHLQGFWWFGTSKCLALIGVYGALLWLTTTSNEEAEFYRQKLVDYKWSLRVRAKSSRFVSNAIITLNQALGKLDIKHPMD
ncbi:hypothetical protein BX600DRAFT_484344 [Xylariales sp. PMI_506]|nr:hypothetical protein BX600DRAFT_484344 [Xylariales sp. PMI_506]